MTGLKKGFVTISKEKFNPEIIVYRCIINQEAHCAEQIFGLNV